MLSMHLHVEYVPVCGVCAGMQSMCRYVEYVVVWLVVCGVFVVMLIT